MQNAIQYTVTYTSIEYRNALPEELTIYSVPDGFEEVDRNPEQWVNNIEEVEDLTGLLRKYRKSCLKATKRWHCGCQRMKTVKLNYTSRIKPE